MKAPNAYSLNYIRSGRAFDAVTQTEDGKWVAARPDGLHSIQSRLSLAWEVFTGRADVLRWPGSQ